MRLLKRGKPPLLVSLPVAAAMAGGLGFGLGTTGIGGPPSHADDWKTPPNPQTGPRPADLGKYTYSSSDCDDGTEVDPITVVFVEDGFPDWIMNHMGQGGWGYVDDLFGDPQYFRAEPAGEPECGQQDGEAKDDTNCGLNLIFCDRFHVRFYMHQYQGEPRVHPHYGGFASASPHYEKDVYPDCGVLGSPHAVADNSEEWEINKITVAGGFNLGREEIKRTWVRNDHTLVNLCAPHPPGTPCPPLYKTHRHPLVDYRDWDNERPMAQCNDWVASSDGRVFYIGVKA